jgi:hypothetical protein
MTKLVECWSPMEDERTCPWDYGSREQDDFENNQNYDDDSSSDWAEIPSQQLADNLKRPGGTLLRSC